ncbi:MAG: CopG family antitoxin [Thermomicrobiales bacterium]
MNEINKMPDTSAEDHPHSIPVFTTEEEAQEFWTTHDSTDYWDQMENVTATPPLQLATGPGRAGSRARKRPPEGRMDLVSLRFPSAMIEAVKEIAAERHLPYQTLMRSWIGERLAQEGDYVKPEAE